MEDNDFKECQPLVIAYGYKKRPNETIFLGYNREITVEGCDSLLQDLLPLCNGINQLEDIMGMLVKEYDVSSLRDVIEVLLENEIIIDSRRFYQVFHKRSMNPPWYFRRLSEGQIADILCRKNTKEYKNKKEIFLANPSEIDSVFLDFLKGRHSIWKYATKKISFNKFCGLPKAAYGVIRREDLGLYVIPHRTVPSGGALYPLETYFITLTDIGQLEKGLYCFQKDKESLVVLKKGDFKEKLKELLVEANETIESASLFMVITAFLERECEKYSNRGYRHVLLEAGHVAQNVYLYCLDQNLDTVELSGFLDEELGRFLGLKSSEEVPITVLAVGGR